MPAVARLGDMSTGHDGFPARGNDSASPNVFINNIAAHRVGDHWPLHCTLVCHDGVESTGSPTVFVNNQPVARVGDNISCGDQVAAGSPNVFAN